MKYEFNIIELEPEFRLAIKSILMQLDASGLNGQQRVLLRQSILDNINSLYRKVLRVRYE